jgi:hypothetical protein
VAKKPFPLEPFQQPANGSTGALPFITRFAAGDGPALFDIYKRRCLYYTNPVQAKQINRQEVPMDTGENAVSYFEQGNN